MDQETLRTLITAVSASIAVVVTAVFGYVSLERKERLARLERDLKNYARQLEALFLIEDSMVAEIAALKPEAAQSIRKRHRRAALEKTGGRITLTAAHARHKRERLG